MSEDSSFNFRFTSNMAAPSRSEDELGQKWDRCLADTGIKMASGLGLGIIFSVLFFKRRPWPLAFGVGTGFGMGYANCQNDFQSPFRVGKLVKIAEKASQDINTS